MQGRTREDRPAETEDITLSGVPPHFAGDGVRLYRGDALQLLARLPAGSVDAVTWSYRSLVIGSHPHDEPVPQQPPFRSPLTTFSAA